MLGDHDSYPHMITQKTITINNIDYEIRYTRALRHKLRKKTDHVASRNAAK